MNGLPLHEFRLADRYLADECTPEECAHVSRLAGERADGWQTITALHEAFVYKANSPIPGTDEARERLGARLAMLEALPVAPTMAARTGDRVSQPPRWLQGARKNAFTGKAPRVQARTWYASIGLACAGVLLMLSWGGRATRTLYATRVSPLVYTTGNGQRANITLSDGTTVSLNVASRLEVPADYLAGNHALRLNGEAVFTVVHRDRTPFTVTAGDATTRVLGTSFLVRHYATDTTTTVAVREGRVMVHAQVVSATQEIEVSPRKLLRVRRADPAQFSFASGVLALNSVPLSTAIVQLNRWYDADIRLGDPTLAAQRLTGEYAPGSIAELSNILALTFDVRIVRNGRILTLYAR